MRQRGCVSRFAVPLSATALLYIELRYNVLNERMKGFRVLLGTVVPSALTGRRWGGLALSVSSTTGSAKTWTWSPCASTTASAVTPHRGPPATDSSSISSKLKAPASSGAFSCLHRIEEEDLTRAISRAMIKPCQYPAYALNCTYLITSLFPLNSGRVQPADV